MSDDFVFVRILLRQDGSFEILLCDGKTEKAVPIEYVFELPSVMLGTKPLDIAKWLIATNERDLLPMLTHCERAVAPEGVLSHFVQLLWKDGGLRNFVLKKCQKSDYVSMTTSAVAGQLLDSNSCPARASAFFAVLKDAPFVPPFAVAVLLRLTADKLGDVFFDVLRKIVEEWKEKPNIIEEALLNAIRGPWNAEAQALRLGLRWARRVNSQRHGFGGVTFLESVSH